MKFNKIIHTLNNIYALVGVVTNKKYISIATLMLMKTDELYHPQFFTVTIIKWKHLLVNNELKNSSIDSLRFLRNEGSIVVYAFVIMPNHIHLLLGLSGMLRPGWSPVKI